MEEFRELALLLRNYSADAQIQVIDTHTIKQFPFWETNLPDDEINQPIATSNELSALTGQDKLRLRTRFWNTLLFLDLNQEELISFPIDNLLVIAISCFACKIFIANSISKKEIENNLKRVVSEDKN